MKKKEIRIGEVLTGIECQDLIDITNKTIIHENPKSFYCIMKEQIEEHKEEIEDNKKLIRDLEACITKMEKACGKIEAHTGVKIKEENK